MMFSQTFEDSVSGVSLPQAPTLEQLWAEKHEVLTTMIRERLQTKKESVAHQHRQRAAQAGQECTDLSRRAERLRDSLRAVLVEDAAGQRLDEGRALSWRNREVGVVVVGRTGECWQWGKCHRELKRRLSDAHKRRLDVWSPAVGRSCGSPRSARTAAAIAHAAATKLRQTQESIQQDVEARLRGLDSEKMLHVKECRRRRDEQLSSHRLFPQLDGGRYVLLSLLGRGGFSEVWRAADVRVGRYVAVKIHKLNPEWSVERRAQHLRHTRREYEIQKSSCHPRIVRLYGRVEVSETSFATVLEYTPFGDLDSKLKGEGPLAEATAKPIMAQILSGLAYLHGIRVIHYDLKPANVLFFSECELKLTDFGLSKSITGPHAPAGEDTAIELTSQGAGTYWYLPPECFETNVVPRVTAKVDVFSAGVVFYQMLFGKRPFGHSATQRQLYTQGIMLNARVVDFPHRALGPITSGAQQTIRTCLSHSPTDRPSAADLLSSEYFSGVPDAVQRSCFRPPTVSEASSEASPTLLPFPGEGVTVHRPAKRRRVIPSELPPPDSPM